MRLMGQRHFGALLRALILPKHLVVLACCVCVYSALAPLFSVLHNYLLSGFQKCDKSLLHVNFKIQFCIIFGNQRWERSMSAWILSAPEFIEDSIPFIDAAVFGKRHLQIWGPHPEKPGGPGKCKPDWHSEIPNEGWALCVLLLTYVSRWVNKNSFQLIYIRWVLSVCLCGWVMLWSRLGYASRA